jgi:hypothetical protein
MKRRELIVDERERGPYGPYIHATGDKRTNERTTSLNRRQTNDMMKAEGFLTNPKKHLELQEASRTPTIVLSCLRVHLDTQRTECAIMLDHSQRACKKETDGRIVSPRRIGGKETLGGPRKVV